MTASEVYDSPIPYYPTDSISLFDFDGELILEWEAREVARAVSCPVDRLHLKMDELVREGRLKRWGGAVFTVISIETTFDEWNYLKARVEIKRRAVRNRAFYAETNEKRSAEEADLDEAQYDFMES